MIDKKKQSVIMGFCLLIVIFYIAWEVLAYFVGLLRASDPKMSAAIVGGMATVFVGLAAVIITQRQIKLREVEEAHRAKKVEIYERFLGVVQSIFSGSNDEVSQEAPSNQELVDFLVGFKTELILWGSPNVIKCQLEFQRVSGASGDVFLAVDNLYKAIREDIGLSNKGLDNLELVKMYMSDPNEIDQKREELNS